jgi:hypothetical protein
MVETSASSVSRRRAEGAMSHRLVICRDRRRRASPRPGARGAADAGQHGRFLDHGIGLGEVGIAGIETAAPEETLHPHGDPREHDADLVIRRGRQRPEIERVPLARSVEDAVQEQRVEMEVQFNPPPKRWMTVTHPDRPSRIPYRRAR